MPSVGNTHRQDLDVILIIAEHSHHDGFAFGAISGGPAREQPADRVKLHPVGSQLDRLCCVSPPFVVENHPRELLTLFDQMCASVRVQQPWVSEANTTRTVPIRQLGVIMREFDAAEEKAAELRGSGNAEHSPEVVGREHAVLLEAIAGAVSQARRGRRTPVPAMSFSTPSARSD